MKLKIQSMKEGEWILLHDFYCESPEPDAPKVKFNDLNEKERQQAAKEYSSSHFKSVVEENIIIGFVGFFPDDDSHVNLFCVVAPEHRGKGYFSKILFLSLDYCRKVFVGYKYVRGLTRKQNVPSIKGLQRFSFIRKSEIIEEVQPDVIYEEYLLPI